MKKYILIISVVLILALLCSCGLRTGDNDTTEETTEGIQIIYPEPDGKRIVMLDAGHGFRDIGCSSDLLVGTEAEVNLAITLLLKAELEKQGITVILTHDGESAPSADQIKTLADEMGIEYIDEDIADSDVFSAYERAVYSSAVARKESVDLFLSLHVNSVENKPEISRYEIDYYRENPYSSSLAVFSESLAGVLDNETKIYADDYESAFRVTKHGTHPAVLLEMGYATNERDSKNLNSPEWRAEFAETLAQSIAEWISSYEGK